MTYLFLFIFGLAIGSFLNVVSLRFQPGQRLLDLRIINGRSHCPHCQKTLRWYELIPLLSFIVQFGKCRHCKKKLSLQYPLVEFLSGLIFVSVPLLLTNFQFSPPAGGFNFQKKSKIFEGLLEKIKEINAKEKAIFFKIEPGADFPFNLSDFGFMKSKKEIQPSQTVILDLTKTEEELLAEMKSKTRYNINLAERKDIKITQQTTHNSQLTTFLELLKETAEREGFRLHPKEYYEKLFAAHSPNFSVKLFLAEYNGKTIAAHLLVFFGNPARTTDVIQSGGQAVYLHGASSREHKDAMAPYLLHWEAIKEAKRRGYLTYDFWGISEKKWPGLTRFKKGFGGAEKEYPGAFDLVFAQFWYWVYNIVRKII